MATKRTRAVRRIAFKGYRLPTDAGRRHDHPEGQGYRLHMTDLNNNKTVWLNTEVGDFDGLCIGTGNTQYDAVCNAVGTLDAAARKLRDWIVSASLDDTAGAPERAIRLR
jgi:hypothetical protein